MPLDGAPGKEEFKSILVYSVSSAQRSIKRFCSRLLLEIEEEEG